MTISEERLALALTVAGMVGVWDGDLNRDLVYGDPNFAEIYGLDPLTVARGIPRGAYSQFVHPDDLEQVRADMARMFESTSDFTNEHRILHPIKGPRWVLTRGRLLRGDDGVPFRFSGISIDITVRKSAERRQAFLLALSDRLRVMNEPKAILREAVSRLGAHLAANRVGYGQVLPDDASIALDAIYTDGVAPNTGVFQMDTFGAHNFVRLRQGETVVVNDVNIDPLNDPEIWAALDARAVASVPLIRDGRLRATLYVSRRTPHLWSTEEVRLIEEVADRIWDAIERSRSETALRELNDRLEYIVEERTRERDRLWELSEDLLVTADYEGRLLRISPSWTRLLERSQTELLSQDYRELIHADERSAAEEALSAMKSNNCPTSFECRLRAADGAWRWVAWTFSPEPKGDRLFGIGRDITAAKQREAELEAAQAALRQSQKMEAVGQLTGGIAHDFNNLLTGIQGSLELMETRVAQGRIDELGRFLSTAQSATKRAAALTHRLLAFSRRQTLDSKPTDVNRLIAELEDLVRRTVGPAITVEIACEPELWPTLIDANQLESAVLNLCINARDAMPQGGRLSIETRNAPMDDVSARERDLTRGDYIHLVVRDTGLGMTPKIVARAFDPFFTTKPIGMGTGLGLSMVYGFARQSGGQAHITSSAGQGAAVGLYLPRYYGGVSDAEAAIKVEVAASRSDLGETVLIVDDEPTIRLLASDVLEDLGYAVVQAADAAEGLRHLRSGGRIDLLITDVGLPGDMNGRQLADTARMIRADLKILFITGYAETALTQPLQLDEHMHVLTKPFTLEVLASRIKAIIQQEV